MPGSIPRRIRTISPASVIGSVVTTSRGLTYVMWPQAGQACRSRSSPSTLSKESRAPHREQKLSEDSIQRGTPRPDGRSVERPSGPRSNGSVTAVRRASSSECPSSPALMRVSREQDQDRCSDERDQPDDAHGDPGQPESTLAPVDRHPGPGGTPDPE